MRFDGDVVWRASRTPQGPVAQRLEVADSELRSTAWGTGASWVSDHLQELVGEHQEDGAFCTDNPVVRELHRRFIGLRIPKSRTVIECLIPSIIEQRVTSREARSTYHRLTRALSEPAPGPYEIHGLMLPPHPQRIADTPYWAFHPFGLERKRADTLRRACSIASKLDDVVELTPDDATRRLSSVQGIGPWTAAEVSLTALGDPDAVVVGDFHLHNWVAWALAREVRGDDDRMLELLEPFRGQRGWVTRLIVANGDVPPKFGARYNPIPIANL